MIEAVKARIKMDENLTDVQRRQDNVDKTWALLRSANTGVINNASDEGSVALGGWLALIKAYNDNIRQPVQLSQALQSWKSAYPNHAAAILFPKELQSMLNFPTNEFSSNWFSLTFKRRWPNFRYNYPIRFQ